MFSENSKTKLSSAKMPRSRRVRQALFADVLLSNGTTQQFVSDYISVDNSVNATTGGSAGATAAIPELNFFTIGPVDYTKFELNPFVEQSVRQNTNKIGATFKFEKILSNTF